MELVNINVVICVTKQKKRFIFAREKKNRNNNNENCAGIFQLQQRIYVITRRTNEMKMCPFASISTEIRGAF